MGSNICDAFNNLKKKVHVKKKIVKKIPTKHFFCKNSLHRRNYTYKHHTQNLVSVILFKTCLSSEIKQCNIIADPLPEQSATQKHDVIVIE